MNKIKINNEDKICAYSDYSELNKVRKFVISKAHKFGFPEIEANKIALAVDEACTNIIRHSYNFQKDKKFCIQIEAELGQFTVCILDYGSAFNPLDVEQIDIKDYIKNYKRGGLGIHIIRSVMDKISYFPSDETRPQNILKLTKNLG